MSVRLKIIFIMLGFYVFSGIAFTVYSGAITNNYRQLRTAEVSKTVAYESERIRRSFSELERSVIDIAAMGNQAYRSGRAPEDLGNFMQIEDYSSFRPFYNAGGAGVWFEPYILRSDTQRAYFYIFFDHETSTIIHDPAFGSEEYDYHTQSWYTEITSRLEGRGTIAWAAPYFESIGTVSLLNTVGAGIYDENARLIGIATVDWKIQTMMDRLSSIKITPNCFILLASLHDDYIISSTYEDGNDLTGDSLQALPWLEYLHLNSTNNDDVNIEHFIKDNVEYIAFSRLFDNGWLFSIQVPRSEIFAEVESRNIRFSVVIVILWLILLLAAFYLVSRLVNRPLNKLTSGVVELGAGNLNKQIDIRSRDEFGLLATAFNEMTADLITSIEQIAQEQAAKQRIVAELSVAANIQASMLPCIFPPFPDRTEFDIYAYMQPAKEVGGDFYDFFMIDHNTLAVVIADVSGKGVPAALFMVIAKTLIKNNAQYGKTPKEVFETVNNLLCENNETSMFVTAFLGYLDIPEGKFTYVNAGHNPPLVKNSLSEYKYMQTKNGFVLGGIANTTYRQHEISFQLGDELFLYTDGITEAVNNRREFFGEELLLETVCKHHGIPIDDFIFSIRRDLIAFTEGSEQFDDITMLALRYNVLEKKQQPNVPFKELILNAEIKNLPDVFIFMESALQEHGYPVELKNQIKLVIEEIFINIANYAYTPDTGSVAVRLWAGDEITIEFEDSGVPYNPLEKSDPDTTLSAGEREIGGLGIYLVKKTMDHLAYKYQDGKNILTIKKTIPDQLFH